MMTLFMLNLPSRLPVRPLSGYPNNQNFYLHYGDLTDLHALVAIIRDVRPTEVYNLAAQSHVQVSFQMPMYTAEVDGVGTLNLLEAIRLSGQTKTCRFYQASTSELYGKVQAIPQDEDTPFYPRSPYAVAKTWRTGPWSTTASRTTCTPATASSSTTSPPAAVRRS